MANLQGAQQEAMATIDAAKVLVDKVLSILQLITLNPKLSLTFALNPIGYILQLLEHLGVTYEELRDFISKFIIYIIPLLEISVKAILLTNLKNMISCTTDPRIPDKYRKRHKVVKDYNTSQEYGIDINLESIDFYNKLSINPLSDEGKNWYFGLEGVNDVYKFARADDFDAFLWFVMHKGNFPNSSSINDLDDLSSRLNATVVPNDGSLLNKLTLIFSELNPSHVLPGNTFKYAGTTHTISMCVDAAYNLDNKITENTLVPVSDDWNSVNWYIRRADQLTKNLGIGSGVPRDYEKERGICNLQFLDQANAGDTPLNGLVNNKFRFTILPKPYIHVPYINQQDLRNSEPPWRFKKLTFDANGNYDINGKYTIDSASPEEVEDGYVEIDYGSQIIAPKPKIKINIRSGSVIVDNKEDLVKHLYECYPGLTVFEFNYDYVMGMRLFDAKVIATTLLDSLINMRLGLNLNMGMKHQEGTDEINEILKSIIESDDAEIEDCFFEFNNDKYNALLKNAAERRANKVPTSTVIQILNEFDNVSGDSAGQVDILNRAITQASVSITEGLPEKDQFKVKFDFVTDLIEQLTLAIVRSILSPKVLMLFEVNETIMGGKWQKFTIKDLIKAMRSIITSIIKEIRDLIIQELMKLLLKILSPIIAVLISSIVREQIEAYTEAIDEIIRNCPVIWFNMGNKYSATKLDVVDYADIDTTETKDGGEPKRSNC